MVLHDTDTKLRRKRRKRTGCPVEGEKIDEKKKPLRGLYLPCEVSRPLHLLTLPSVRLDSNLEGTKCKEVSTPLNELNVFVPSFAVQAQTFIQFSPAFQQSISMPHLCFDLLPASVPSTITWSTCWTIAINLALPSFGQKAPFAKKRRAQRKAVSTFDYLLGLSDSTPTEITEDSLDTNPNDAHRETLRAEDHLHAPPPSSARPFLPPTAATDFTVAPAAGARLSEKPTSKRPSHEPRTESTESASTVHEVA
ncbi:hypothetical protein CCUS01_07366 [Colletotrichum cuscutae]|uniref:Uncharacterized protein n=1 Tax=Colletotrichum cuscutae TaxID=1209917 RepID=A0AAI9XWH1_9PEZI|nr:hypothetical protein CCUS01_07366 [Colletotrichum cuscutae]